MMEITRRKTTKLITIALSLLFVGYSPAMGAETASVRMGFVPVVTAAPLALAIEKGYFKEAGIRNELVQMRDSNLRLQALMAGQLDINWGGFGGDVVNAMIEGAPLRIVADNGQEKKGMAYAYLLVRKDLWDSGVVRDYKDFKGKTISIGGPKGSINHMFLLRALQRGGLTMKDINFVLVSHPEASKAFAAKAIDIAYTLEPFTTRALEMGVAHTMAPTVELAPKGIQTAILMMNTNFIRQRRSVAQAWMNTFLKGVSDYNAALTQGVKKEEFFNVVAKYTKLDLALVRKVGFPFIDSKGKLNEESTLEQLDYLHDEGILRRKIASVTEIVDYSLLPK